MRQTYVSIVFAVIIFVIFTAFIVRQIPVRHHESVLLILVVIFVLIFIFFLLQEKTDE